MIFQFYKQHALSLCGLVSILVYGLFAFSFRADHVNPPQAQSGFILLVGLPILLLAYWMGARSLADARHPRLKSIVGIALGIVTDSAGNQQFQH